MPAGRTTSDDDIRIDVCDGIPQQNYNTCLPGGGARGEKWFTKFDDSTQRTSARWVLRSAIMAFLAHPSGNVASQCKRAPGACSRGMKGHAIARECQSWCTLYTRRPDTMFHEPAERFISLKQQRTWRSAARTDGAPAPVSRQVVHPL